MYQYAILELATNFWLLVLSILHNHVKRIIKQASLSHWVANSAGASIPPKVEDATPPHKKVKIRTKARSRRKKILLTIYAIFFT